MNVISNDMKQGSNRVGSAGAKKRVPNINKLAKEFPSNILITKANPHGGRPRTADKKGYLSGGHASAGGGLSHGTSSSKQVPTFHNLGHEQLPEFKDVS